MSLVTFALLYVFSNLLLALFVYSFYLLHFLFFSGFLMYEIILGYS